MISFTKLRLTLTAHALLTCLTGLAIPVSAAELVLRYDKPATRW
jgi:hypothetical protein